MVELSDIKPASAKSAKYSHNLYVFMRIRRRVARQRLRVVTFSRKPNSSDPWPFDYSDPHPANIWIGRPEEDWWFIGRRLSDILAGFPGYTTLYAHDVTDWPRPTDLTDWFWGEYRRIGRALWDARGETTMIGDEDRWEKLSDVARRCRWSGRVYNLREYTRTVTEQRWELV